MVSVAAGIASEGLPCFVYSIASFLYTRPFEQIRNDVCFHALPVKMIGNGAGYGYGVMGPTHHALEDYGVLRTLPRLRIFAPAFNDDLEPMIYEMLAYPGPCYLRLGRDERPANAPKLSYGAWRNFLPGAGPLLVTISSIAGSLYEPLVTLEEDLRPDVWCVSELPFTRADIPPRVSDRLMAGASLVVVEEHVRAGGLGEMLASELTLMGISPNSMIHLYAQGYLTSKAGDQLFYRHQSRLSIDYILKAAGI
jgi:transketolase